MIELTLEDLALIAVGGAMLLVGLFSLISQASAAKSERRSLKRRRVCAGCLAVFEAEERTELCRCPSCGAPVDREGPKPLG